MNPDLAESNNNPEDGDNLPWLVTTIILIGVILMCGVGLAFFYSKSKQSSAARHPSFLNPAYQTQWGVNTYNHDPPDLSADGEVEI